MTAVPAWPSPADSVDPLDKVRDELVERDRMLAAERAQRARLEDALSDLGRQRVLLDRTLSEALVELADLDEHARAHQANAARLRAELADTKASLDQLASTSLVRIGRRMLWPAARAGGGVRDLLAGRGGQQPDAVLRWVGRYLPALVPVLGARVRPVSRRDAALHGRVALPTDPVLVGRGQVVEVVGWLRHGQLPVRSVRVRAGGRAYPASISRPPADLTAGFDLTAGPDRAAGPAAAGFRVRLPVGVRSLRGDPDRALALELLVELADGTLLRRPLPALRLVAGNGARPLPVRWRHAGPRVAICMATYRPPGEFLAQQLASIRAQTHRNWVCVISDDGSDPASLALLRRLTRDDPRFVVVAHEDNVGFYRNFERALRLVPADADAIALSDQDDLWDPDKLEVLLGRLAEPGVQLVCSDQRLIDGKGTVLADSCWGDRPRHRHADLGAMLLLNTVTGAASMLRADLVRQRVLPFPPGTVAAYHDQWMGACARATGRVVFLDRAVHSYRQHGANVTGWQDPDLAAGLPGPLGLIGVALGRALRAGRPSGGLSPAKAAELDHIAEHELPRIAQFATVLLLRNNDLLDQAARAELVRLARADRQLLPLVELALRANGRRETAGAEHRLLAARLRPRGHGG